MYKNQQAGFTLIELVVVIVILGILSTVAAPKFMDLSSSAKISALEGVSGTLISAAHLVYAKSIIEGVASEESASIDIDSDGVDDVDITFGYPTGERTGGIANVAELNDDWAYGDTFGGTELHVTSSSVAGFSGITNNNIPIRSPNCYLTYIPPSEEGEVPAIEYTTSGC